MAGKKSTAAMELAIGATIIAGVVILIVMLMLWGNSTSLLGRHYRVIVNMANVGGLKNGAPVKMGGFQIGRVASIQIRTGATDMELVLDIEENRILPKDSTAKVSTAGLVGDAFMEIVPGKSSETLRRAATIADAEHLESSPLPDMSELMAKVGTFGDQLNLLTENLNAIVGDLQFRKSIKSMAGNIDEVSHQATLVLQRSQSVIENVDLAAKNLSALASNLDSGITEARNTLRNTIGNPEVAENLGVAIKNIGELSGDLKTVASRVKAISDGIRPEAVASSFRTMTTAIDSIGGMVERVKSEPVLALSINKAADRIVKMKFDEMARQGLGTADAVSAEVNRWAGGSLDRGVFEDPAYSYEARPYALEEMEATGDSAAEKRPYMND